MLRSTIGFILLAVMAFPGCSADHSEEIVSLQKQVAALTHQIEDLRKQTDAAQDGQQKLRELVSNLEVEVGRLKPREVSSPTQASPTSKEQGVIAAPTSKPAPPVKGQGALADLAPKPAPGGATKMSCPQVWRMLGQGTDEATIAKSLGATEAAVQKCIQEIGQKKKRR